MAGGVLSFPLTSFGDNGDLDPDSYRTYLGTQLPAGPGVVFPAWGTGEFGALDEDEYRSVVTTAVEVAGGRDVAGIGYGRAQARRFARIAEEAGADGLLVLPHYLVTAPQDGLVEQLRRIAEIPTVIGLKDGRSDLDLLQRLTLAAPSGFLFFNGAATAEIQARADATVGVPAYSSAVHAFASEIAHAFFAALTAADGDAVNQLLREFYVPLVELRDRVPGYAVSLVKAAARLRGLPVGPVRAPLTDPGPDDLADLAKVLDTGLALVGAARRLT
jgi:5-dehydro-4-deoxyglucarate dehydratase